MRILLLAFAALAATGSGASGMTYRLLGSFDDGRCPGGCPQAIVAEGTIQLDEPQRLAAFLGQLGGGMPRTMILHSPGGNVAGALKLGLGLRRLGVRTVVARAGRTDGGAGPVALGGGICASACVFALMGGPTRIVPSGSHVVVHAARHYGEAIRDPTDGGFITSQPNPEAVTLLLQRYAGAMGVDPALVSLVQSVPHESARLLSPTEVRRFRLAATGGATPSRRATRGGTNGRRQGVHSGARGRPRALQRS